jgi:hypothetical protein
MIHAAQLIRKYNSGQIRPKVHDGGVKNGCSNVSYQARLEEFENVLPINEAEKVRASRLHSAIKSVKNCMIFFIKLLISKK